MRPVFEPLFAPDLYDAFMPSCVMHGMADVRYGGESAADLLNDGFKITYFKIHLPRIHGDKAEVSVRFINDPRNSGDKDQREAFYRLIKTEKGWRISDIEWSYGRAIWKPYESIEDNPEIPQRESLIELLKD